MWYCMSVCSIVSDSVIPWTVAHQAPLSTGFSWQEYWSGLPFAPPGDLPNPGIEPRSSVLQADSLPSEPPGKPFLRNLLFHLFTLQHEPRQDMEMSYPFVHENVQSQHGWLGSAKILSEKATIFLHKAAKHLHATNWSWFSKCRDTIWKPRLFCSFNLACLISFTI